MDINKMKLNSNKVKAARISKGYNQKDIAKELDIMTSTYAEKENGNSEFKLKEAIVMSELLNMPIEEIFFYSGVEMNSTSKESA